MTSAPTPTDIGSVQCAISKSKEIFLFQNSQAMESENKAYGKKWNCIYISDIFLCITTFIHYMYISLNFRLYS